MLNDLKIYGVQLHPESVLSTNDDRIISFFLIKCGYKPTNEEKFQSIENKLKGNIKWLQSILLSK